MAADAPTVHTASLLADKVVISIVCVDGDLRDYYFTNVTQALRHELSVGEVLVTQAEKDVSQDSVAALQDRCKKQVEQFVEWQRDADKDRAALICRHSQELADLRNKLTNEYRTVAQRAEAQLTEARALADKNRALKAEVQELGGRSQKLEHERGELKVALAKQATLLEEAIVNDRRQKAELTGLREELATLRDEHQLYREDNERLDKIVREKDRLRNEAVRTLADAEKAIQPLLTVIDSFRQAVTLSSPTPTIPVLVPPPAPVDSTANQRLEILLNSYQEQRARVIEAAERCREVIDPLERKLEDNKTISAHTKSAVLEQERAELTRQLAQPHLDYTRLMKGASALAMAEEAVTARLNALAVLAQPLSDEVLAGPQALLDQSVETLEPAIERVPAVDAEAGIDVVDLAQRAQTLGLSVLAYLTVCFLDIIPLKRSGISRLFAAARKTGFVTVDPTDHEIDGGDLKGNKALSKYIQIMSRFPNMTRDNYGRTQTAWDNPLSKEQRAAFITAFEELAPPSRKNKTV